MSYPEHTNDELLSYRHHTFGPVSELNAIEMALISAMRQLPECFHCHVSYRMLPMYGDAWGLEHFHEDGCPDKDDEGE